MTALAGGETLRLRDVHCGRAADVRDLRVEVGERVDIRGDARAAALLRERLGARTIRIEDAGDGDARRPQRESMQEPRDTCPRDDRSQAARIPRRELRKLAQALAFSDSSAAAMVASMIASSCAVPMNAASYCEGGQ